MACSLARRPIIKIQLEPKGDPIAKGSSPQNFSKDFPNFDSQPQFGHQFVDGKKS
jgi:hypothetical protein